MLSDSDKIELSNIITRYRPDLKKELLLKDSYIYSLIEEELKKSSEIIISPETLEQSWININLENPIPNMTSEIDLIIETNFAKLKEELEGLAMYSNVLIAVAEKDNVKEIYENYSFFSEAFTHTPQFDEDLRKEVERYLLEEGYI